MNDLCQNLVILGASGHALVVADIIRLINQYKIIGFLDEVNLHLHGKNFCGVTILGGREKFDQLHDDGVEYSLIAIGNCQARLELSNLVEQNGFRLATAVHPQAIVAGDIVIGSGTVICAGAVINPGAKIGKNVIINTTASVDHECIIEDGVHIGPGAHIGGRTTIKQGAWIGIGATVSDRITIGANSIIGAGAVVVRDIPPGVVAYGVPARVMRGIKEC
ncbi:acetyltransferase [Dolichospermum circinale]|uniref:acetyltransferase n=1 Tax=Dolichospermum circinale TaxID=109265 RepID=UPI00232D7335|nr:acetyltransferase [Dolichospermum circinale]MDB9456388.1 acetyltransferase [Dolichospermum circinale CS-541/06]MDB9462985.1 acetyltransferase [Dolichospermum circinale CS-541/04]